jgi:hypothetical protein
VGVATFESFVTFAGDAAFAGFDAALSGMPRDCHAAASVSLDADLR